MTDMRTDDDLERLLRSTLTTAGDTVTTGPTWQRADDELLPDRSRRRWLAPVAAAAAAAVVAGIIVASRQQHDDDAPPSTPSPSITRNTSPNPTPTPTKLGVDVTRAACSVPLPAAWATATAKGTTAAGSDDVDPLAVIADGRVVVSRNLGAIRDVALLAADGHADSIFTVPAHDDYVTAQSDGNAVLIVAFSLGTENGEQTTRATDIAVLNTRNGFDGLHAPANQVIDGAALLDGHVYYDERAHYANAHGRIWDIDLANSLQKPPTVVFTGNVAAPKLFGGGISWAPTSYRIDVPRPVPAVVAKETRTQPKNRDPAVTDGTSWAWADNADGVAWYRKGQPGPVHVRVGSGVSVYAVTGDYVLYRTGGDLKARLLDVRTGAAVVLPGVAPTLTAGSGVVAVAVSTGAAKDSPTKVLRLDTTKLPGLTC